MNSYSIKRQMIRDTFERREKQKKIDEEYVICLIYYFMILFMIYSQFNYMALNYK